MSLIAQSVTLNWLQNRRLVSKAGLSTEEAWNVVLIHSRHVIIPTLAATAVLTLVPEPVSWIGLGLQAGIFCLICGGASLLLDRELVQLLLRRGRLG